jgi:ketosteroid isomerase-like protein
MVADFAPDFEYESTGALPGARGISRGPVGYRNYMRDWFVSGFDTRHIEVQEMIELGDRIVEASTNRGRGKQSGVKVAWEVWIVWSFRDGMVVHGRGFTSRTAALKAAGLSE